MNYLLQKNLSSNSTKISIFELIDPSTCNTTIETQQKLSELNYLPWSFHILKYGLHYASLKCIPLPVLPISVTLLKKQPKNKLEDFEKVKLKYDKDNTLELKKELVLESVESALLDCKYKFKKQYGYWTESNQVFVNFGTTKKK